MQTETSNFLFYIPDLAHNWLKLELSQYQFLLYFMLFPY
jgi:hypothetical protein